MRADEIRGWATSATEHIVCDSNEDRLAVIQAQATFEVAAQLAELNSTLRVQSALLAGEGNPQ